MHADLLSFITYALMPNIYKYIYKDCNLWRIRLSNIGVVGWIRKLRKGIRLINENISSWILIPLLSAFGEIASVDSHVWKIRSVIRTKEIALLNSFMYLFLNS